MQKAKWLSEEALQIAVKRREVKSKGEKYSPRTNKTNLNYNPASGIYLQNKGKAGL